MLNPIIGKKIILFPLAPTDLDHFVQLHRGDKQGYMQRFCLKEMSEEEAKNYIGLFIATSQIFVFTVMTKEGKASRRGGYIYFSDITDFAVTLNGIMDVELMKGLGRVIRKEKYTFSEDAIITLINWAFSNMEKLERIQTEVVERNRLSLLLNQKCGFKKEGVLRDYLKVNDRRENVVMLSILKREWENELRQKGIVLFSSAVPEASVNRI